MYRRGKRRNLRRNKINPIKHKGIKHTKSAWCNQTPMKRKKNKPPSRIFSIFLTAKRFPGRWKSIKVKKDEVFAWTLTLNHALTLNRECECKDVCDNEKWFLPRTPNWFAFFRGNANKSLQFLQLCDAKDPRPWRKEIRLQETRSEKPLRFHLVLPSFFYLFLSFSVQFQ